MQNWKENRYMKISVYAFLVVAASIVLLMLTQNVSKVMGWVSLFFDIVSPFIWGFAFAYILNYPYKLVLKGLDNIPKIGKKISKGIKVAAALIIVYAVSIAILVLFFYAVVPQIVTAISDFLHVLPTYIDELELWFQGFMYKYLDKFGLSIDDIYEILNQAGERISGEFDYATMFTKIVDIVLETSVKLKNIFLGLVVSIYFLLDKDKFRISCKKLLYAVVPTREKADEIVKILAFTDKTFGGFFIAKVVDSTIIGIMCYIFMAIMKMEYAVVISVLVGVTNIIPFFGPFIGAIPSILLLLLVNPWHSLIFGIFIIILQQFDGNFLGPKLMGDTMGIRAVFVVFAVIVFGGLFGFIGMFIGVPVFVVLYRLFAESVAKRLKAKNIEVK
ncbi:MAG: AI-2E family transporter [Clostridia bacterium]|nr:AI-2E family transporter [Clostridia bacterium]